MPDTEGVKGVAPKTRAQRRAARLHGPRAGARTGVGSVEAGSVTRVPVTFATVALCLLLGVSGLAGAWFVAAAVVLAGLVLAWGWPALMGSPSRVGATTVLTIGAVLSALAVALTASDPFLRYLPIALACSLIAAFLHQLLRRDGRPRLTESVAITTAGLAVLGSGAALVALPRTYDGSTPVAAAATAIAVSAVVDLAAGARRLRGWMPPAAMLLGGVAGLLVFHLAGPGRPVAAFLIGALSAGVSHALRRVISVLPPMTSTRSQLVSASSSVLVTGVVVYALARGLLA